MNHSSHGCPGVRELLAREGECVVERCVCGTVFLSLGALTIRLHEEAFAQLARLLDQAKASLATFDLTRSPDHSGTLVS